MNRPPRFTIARDSIRGGVARLGGDELHHLRDVMRLKAGARVALIDERGAEYRGVIRSFEARQAVIEVGATVARDSARGARTVALGAAIIKGPRMDFLVEKAAELGAAELWPIMSARAVALTPGREKIARWRRLVAAAAKQSLAEFPMEIRPPLSFADLIRIVPGDTLRVSCAIGDEPLGAVIRRAKPERILIVCGPEGDFDPEEQAMAEQAGFVRVGLGPNRLRSETAALAALSIAAGAIGELDGGI